MAPQIDFMVKSGLIDHEEGARHPDRNTLTSVLFGAAIPKIDCPEEPVQLMDGDILIVASDGLQFLSDAQITSVLLQTKHRSSGEIADRLLSDLERLEDPDQDNVSFSVIKLDFASDLEGKQITGRHGDIRCVG